MLSRLLPLLLALLLVSCRSKTPSATLSDYGTYDAVILTSGNWKLGVPVTISSITGLKHQQTTSRVPIGDGHYWGFRARLRNPFKSRAVKFRYTIDHPEFTNPDGTKSSSETQELEVAPGDSVEQHFLWFFIEGCEHEFLPGTWTQRLFLDGSEVIRKDFEIYKP